MADDAPSRLGNVITIDNERIKSHLDRLVGGSVEETLNALRRIGCAMRDVMSAARPSRYPGRSAIGVNGEGYRQILGI
jgi:hypothetical protein